MQTNILQRNTAYQQQVEQLLAELASTDESLLNRLPGSGGWSAIQVLHHLILSEELSLAYVRKKLSFPSELEHTGLKSGFRTVSLWFYLNLPIRFKAPKIVGDDNLPAHATLAETRKRWSDIRNAWTDFFHNLPAELENKAVYRHPFAGRLSWMGMLKFFQYHLIRHRKQIRRTLGATA